MQLLVPFGDGIVLLGWHTHYNRNLEGSVFTLYMYVQNGSIYWLKCNGKNSSGSYPISSGCIKSDPYVELYPQLFARLVCWGISLKRIIRGHCARFQIPRLGWRYIQFYILGKTHGWSRWNFPFNNQQGLGTPARYSVTWWKSPDLLARSAGKQPGLHSINLALQYWWPV